MYVFESQAQYFDSIRQRVDTPRLGYLKTDVDMKIAVFSNY